MPEPRDFVKSLYRWHRGARAVGPASDRGAPAHARRRGAAADVERLHEHGFDDIDQAHLTVLRYPGPQGQRPSDLAAQLGMSKQALNYQLGKLERRGYLERRPDPEDLRSRRIVLTRARRRRRPRDT